jgi:hypothetical protein
MPQVTATIPLSGSVSDDIDLRKGRLEAIFVPVLTSGDLLVRGALDQTSANFVRLQHPVLAQPLSGDLRFATGPGSRMILWPDNLPTPSYLRLETSVAQAAAREFTVRYS